MYLIVECKDGRAVDTVIASTETLPQARTIYNVIRDNAMDSDGSLSWCVVKVPN